MRYVRLFMLYAQDVLTYRSVAFIWFLVSLVNPLLYLLFWSGAVTQGNSGGFSSLSEVTNYYFLYLILGGLLMTHIEHEVGYWDIKEGGLIKYILKPLPYIVFKFYLEFVWRIAMGTLSLIATLLLLNIFGQTFSISLTPEQISLAVTISVLALLLSFVFKMIVGLTALWVVDFGGIEQLVFVVTLLFSGYVVPIEMFPPLLAKVAGILPIPYMIYYPIRAVQGKLTISESFDILIIQLCWLIALSIVYKIAWKRGLRRFTGVGL